MDKYSEFIKKQYKEGKIKNVSAAFKDFPPEEEWHHGNIEYFINEPTFYYNGHCKIGDIVFVREYTYSDGTKGYRHMFVIVDSDYHAVPIEYFGMMISSKLEKLKFDTNILLPKDSDNNLDKNSIVKVDELYKLTKEQIVFKIGEVSIKKVEKYKKYYYEIVNK